MLKAYFLIEVDLSIYNITSSLKQTTKTDIMSLKIFKENKINKERAEDENTANQLLQDGEEALSLAQIIETRIDNLNDLLFEVVTKKEEKMEGDLAENK